MYLVSRTETFAKLFFIVSFTGLFMYVALAFYSFHTAYTTVSEMGKYQENNKMQNYDVVVERFDKDLKYILVWTTNSVQAESILQYEGQEAFIERDCPEINCYITTNKTILNDDYVNFDAIVFNMSIFWERGVYTKLPDRRAKRQKYVFYGMQPSDNYPICNRRIDNFFNWTWTYKFYSDIYSPFIEVKNLVGNVVAPNRNVIWKNDLRTSTKSDVAAVITKTKAIAWVLDNCGQNAYIMFAVPKLRKALKQFNLTLDMYGCGNLNCSEDGCSKTIQKEYYFYLAYEGSMTEDYVTAEVLKAYYNEAVPIVVGGADYSRFLPENSYINYQFYTEDKLAAYLHYAITNPAVYNAFFNWKKYYTIVKADEFKGYCDLCKLLNDKKKFTTFSTYENFRSWWYYGSLKDKCLPRGSTNVSEITGYMNESVRF
ncbi:hypothetical protein HW555_000530 [Spodoptera exigua]|uniref:Fucosyltransferase n=1 Tax=Spodoptera exigua TaxID=7107 RepID=A0A835LGA2_SPOEX|nr:hypothetical protein HW555_000530 [Spodoptera exigua]